MDLKRRFFARGTMAPPIAVNDEVRDLTDRLRRRAPDPDLDAFLAARGIPHGRTIVASWAPAGRARYAGHVVTPDRRVLDLSVEDADLPIWTVDDVTEDLGQQDPGHPLCKSNAPVARALRWHDYERRAA
jgi:hypothetical protein